MQMKLVFLGPPSIFMIFTLNESPQAVANIMNGKTIETVLVVRESSP
jgi:hypothetical protein